MTRVLLVEIGTTAGLPVVTPPLPPRSSQWMPNPRPAPGLSPPSGLVIEVMADAAKLTWIRSPQPGAETVVEAAADEDGVPGDWHPVARTGDATYTIALPAGAFWVRLYAVLNGLESVRTAAALAVPVKVGQIGVDVAELLERQLLLEEEQARETQERQLEDARTLAEAAATTAREVAAAREAVEAEVAAAQKRITEILSDEVLTPDEKPQLIIDFNALFDERAGILVEAAASEVDTDDYVGALDRLAAYMATLNTPTRWNDTSGITYLN